MGVALSPSPARAQMRPVEYELPRRDNPTFQREQAKQLALVRRLKDELRLNEHQVIRALRCLRQGNDETYMRKLFAVTVRKS